MGKFVKYLIYLALSCALFIGGSYAVGYLQEDGKEYFGMDVGYATAHECVVLDGPSRCALVQEKEGLKRDAEIAYSGTFEYLTAEQVQQARDARPAYLEKAKERSALNAIELGFAAWVGLVLVAVSVFFLLKIYRACAFYMSVKRAELEARKAAAQATLKRADPDVQNHSVTVKGSVKLEG